MEKLPKFKFKKDSYMRRRGAPSMLQIVCANCNNYLMCYQKDGPGPLLRCYLDRIHHPETLENRQHTPFDKQTAQKLECGHCQALIGLPIIYEKEDRPAYHMRVGSFAHKKIQGRKLPLTLE